MLKTDAKSIQEWFRAERMRLSGNGVWFQGKEPGAQPAEMFSDAPLKLLIVRLSPYNEVSSGITHSYLHQMSTSVDGIFTDMAYMPTPNDEKIMREAGIPLLTGVTSKEPANRFDVIAISNSVLQELLNLPALLAYSGLPLSTQERDAAKSPLILLGGSNSYTLSILHGSVTSGRHGSVTSRGEERTGLVDALLVGDGENAFAPMLTLLRDMSLNINSEFSQITRNEKLLTLQKYIPGFYLPSAYHQIFNSDGALCCIEVDDGASMPLKSNKCACRSGSETYTGSLLLYEDAGKSHLIVSAGCPSFCSFCKESWEQKPYRETELNLSLCAARKLKANLGLNELALMTFNANTCSNIFEFVRLLGEQFSKVAIKSQRFDAIAKAPELLDLQFDAGKRTYTCAMEGISERIRVLLQKNLNEETIIDGINLLLQRNMRQMKVFLIVSGYEQAKDIDEFKDFLERLKKILSQGKSKPKIVFSFATLFRAPQTPMQFAPARASLKELREFLNQLCEIIRESGFEARISSGAEDAEVSEFIAYADRRDTSILVAASVKEGHRYHGEISQKLWYFWDRRLNESGRKLLIKCDRNIDTVFPWDDIDTGVSKAYLYKISQINLRGEEIRACLAEPFGSGHCANCGACSSAEEIAHVNSLGPSVGKRQFLPTSFSGKSCKKNDSVISVHDCQHQHYLNLASNHTFILARIPEKWAFCSREFIAAAIARCLMLDMPETVDWFRRVELVLPDFFSSGLVMVKVIGAGDFPVTLLSQSRDDDISFIKIISSKMKPDQKLFPIVLEGNVSSNSEISRHIDALLTRYKLKHLKQRSGDWLNWQINAGQAKKAGLLKLSLCESSAVLQVILCGWPELFMLNKIFINYPPKVVSFAL